MISNDTVEPGNNQDTFSEADDLSGGPGGVNERQVRLRVILSKIRRISHIVDVEMAEAQSVTVADCRPHRLKAAIETIDENFQNLEQAIAHGNTYDQTKNSGLDENQTALMQEHVGLAYSLARQFVNRGEPLDDLRQVSIIGLIKAAARFDPNEGTPFAGFAVPTITGELKRHFRDRTWSVRVPRPVKEMASLIPGTKDKLSQQYGRDPSVAEIASVLGVEVKSVLDAMQARAGYKPESLTTTGAERVVARTISSLKQEADDYEDIENKILVEELLKVLEPRESIILRARAGLPPFEYEYSQAEIATMLGISQVHAGRLEGSALLKLNSLVTEV